MSTARFTRLRVATTVTTVVAREFAIVVALGSAF
jgi:hypothetical protein